MLCGLRSVFFCFFRGFIIKKKWGGKTCLVRGKKAFEWFMFSLWSAFGKFLAVTVLSYEQ